MNDYFHQLVREIADELYLNVAHVGPGSANIKLELIRKLIVANMHACTHSVTTPMTDEKGPIGSHRKCEACHQVVVT